MSNVDLIIFLFYDCVELNYQKVVKQFNGILQPPIIKGSFIFDIAGNYTQKEMLKYKHVQNKFVIIFVIVHSSRIVGLLRRYW